MQKKGDFDIWVVHHLELYFALLWAGRVSRRSNRCCDRQLSRRTFPKRILIYRLSGPQTSGQSRYTTKRRPIRRFSGIFEGRQPNPNFFAQSGSALPGLWGDCFLLQTGTCWLYIPEQIRFSGLPRRWPPGRDDRQSSCRAVASALLRHWGSNWLHFSKSIGPNCTGIRISFGWGHENPLYMPNNGLAKKQPTISMMMEQKDSCGELLNVVTDFPSRDWRTGIW